MPLDPVHIAAFVILASSLYDCRGYVRGEEGDIPQMVTFQRNCCHGALLATVSSQLY